MNFLNRIKLDLEFHKINNVYNIFEQHSFVYFNSKTNQKEERQGWKIHVSATINNYKKILLLVVKELLKHQVSFKFLKDRKTFIANNNKQTPLTNVGKFITVYPNHNKHFIILLERLYLLLKRYKGINIDTDRRYLDSQNVFYRYGVKFAKINPQYLYHQGKKIIDQRSLTKYHPDFVQDPVKNNVNPQITGKFSDYQIKYCLSKHAGGFVFYAIKNSNNQPHILIRVCKNILNSNKETLIQQRLKEINLFYQKHHDLKIPKITDYFYDSEKNLWLVKEYLEGTTLDLFKNDCAIQIKSTSGKIDFFQIYLNIMKQLVEITVSFHQKGLVLNDVKLNNFLVNKDLEIYFIDPEHSYQLTDHFNYSDKLNTPYQSKLFLKHQHKNLDYHKLGMMIVDLICGSYLFVKLDDSLVQLFTYLEDIFKYYNFDRQLFKLIKKLVFEPEQVDLASVQKQLNNIQNKYQFNSDWIAKLGEKTLNKIKQQIIFLNKNNKKGSNWRLTPNTKLTKFADFLVYFEQYQNWSKDQKQLLKEKLLAIQEHNFYCEILLMIVNHIDQKNNSQVQQQFKTKIQQFIKNNLFQSNEGFYVKKRPYIKYIEDGSSGLCLILIYGKHYLQVDDFDQLIQAILLTTKNPFDQKATLHFGSAGFVFLLLKAYQLWDQNQQYLKDALECCYFLIHQFIDHQTIYEINYKKISVQQIKTIKYITNQLSRYFI